MSAGDSKCVHAGLFPITILLLVYGSIVFLSGTVLLTRSRFKIFYLLIIEREKVMAVI